MRRPRCWTCEPTWSKPASTAAALAMKQKLDCYVHNHCLDDQPSPNPAPLTPVEREQLYSAWMRTV